MYCWLLSYDDDDDTIDGIVMMTQSDNCVWLIIIIEVFIVYWRFWLWSIVEMRDDWWLLMTSIDDGCVILFIIISDWPDDDDDWYYWYWCDHWYWYWWCDVIHWYCVVLLIIDTIIIHWKRLIPILMIRYWYCGNWWLLTWWWPDDDLLFWYCYWQYW